MKSPYPRLKRTVIDSKEKKILTKLDEQITAATSKPEMLEGEIFEAEELHSTIDHRKMQ